MFQERGTGFQYRGQKLFESLPSAFLEDEAAAAGISSCPLPSASLLLSFSFFAAMVRTVLYATAVAALLAVACVPAAAYDNGLGRLPPMGWNVS